MKRLDVNYLNAPNLRFETRQRLLSLTFKRQLSYSWNYLFVTLSFYSRRRLGLVLLVFYSFVSVKRICVYFYKVIRDDTSLNSNQYTRYSLIDIKQRLIIRTQVIFRSIYRYTFKSVRLNHETRHKYQITKIFLEKFMYIIMYMDIVYLKTLLTSVLKPRILIVWSIIVRNVIW